MTYPDLPIPIKSMMADEGVRTHHHLWHFVRSRDSWLRLPEASRRQLIQAGWIAPRFEDEPGSGIDFLGMHRQMIAMVNTALAEANDSAWPQVEAWDPIPWEPDDADWPVPEWQVDPPSWAAAEQWSQFTQIALEMRSPERVADMSAIAQRLRGPERLRTMTLDQLGSDMEWSIHGWMHIRWSGAPYKDAFSVDIDNDWLFLPWSSHVNKHFWKLHGWIDARIRDWEHANRQTADLGSAWSGPAREHGHHHHGGVKDMAAHEHRAETWLLDLLPPIPLVPMPMRTRPDVIERLLD